MPSPGLMRIECVDCGVRMWGTEPKDALCVKCVVRRNKRPNAEWGNDRHHTARHYGDGEGDPSPWGENAVRAMEG